MCRAGGEGGREGVICRSAGDPRLLIACYTGFIKAKEGTTHVE